MNIHGTITVVKNREDGNDVEETNILVVDDEKEIADLLEIYLISDGFQVLKAYSAKEGLRILEEKKIDLVLLDVMIRIWTVLRCAAASGRRTTFRSSW